MCDQFTKGENICLQCYQRYLLVTIKHGYLLLL
nr:MAG TPA: hypothetical protein [Bacteriophage sp.]